MSFWGYTFVFDGVPSETYNLYISTPEGGGLTEGAGSGDVELLTQTVFRNPKPYLLGVQQAPVLSFDIQVLSPDELMMDDIRIIQSWMFGQQTYKKLQVVQYDMKPYYFNCFLTSPRIVKTGNKINGMSGTVVCDSPFAWEFEKTFTHDTSNDSFTIYNSSDDNYYTYPTITITMDSFGGDFTLTNTNDNSRVFEFIGLDADEVVTIDNERNIITSSTGLRRLSYFNKNWFRMIRGGNSISVSGNHAGFSIAYNPARKVA